MSKRSNTRQSRGNLDEDKHEPTEAEQVPESPNESDDGVPLRSSGKRKRQINEENLEIDLALPEPKNRKELRKAKKLKGSEKTENAHLESSNADTNSTGLSTANGITVTSNIEHAPDQSEKLSKVKAIGSIWMGNLPFSATKDMITNFLTSNSQPPIAKSAITRVNVPAPLNAKATKTTIKPLNKGFAYVDFADEQSFAAALALSETPLAGRNVLIKNAKSFEGRPSAHTVKQQSGTNQIVSKRIFVGNLSFDVIVEDLKFLFGKCGDIIDIHMATFEDSGKCKGYAWIQFADTDAAKAAVKGVVLEAIEDDLHSDSEGKYDHQTKKKHKPKKRQWWCNRLHGREVRREYAEEPEVRYAKRFGKASKQKQGPSAPVMKIESGESMEYSKPVHRSSTKRDQNKHMQPGAPTDEAERRGRTELPVEQKAARDRKAKEIRERTQYRSGQLSDSVGTKVTFD